jgi:hypothetical protein
MSKPVWEEEWVYHEELQRCVRMLEDSSVVPLRSEAEHRLASAAPDMARLLLSLEWPVDSDGYSACADCASRRSVGHDRDCDWLRVMRKAGVR